MSYMQERTERFLRRIMQLQTSAPSPPPGAPEPVEKASKQRHARTLAGDLARRRRRLLKMREGL